MRHLLDRAAVSFAAGAFGALVNSVVMWAAGQYGLTARLGVAIAPALTAGWLYPRLVWGGLRGFLFLLPLRASWWLRGLLVSRRPRPSSSFTSFRTWRGKACSVFASAR